jgi:trk system potassium uptake protein TrkH
MRWPFIIRIIGVLLFVLGLSMALPLGCSLFFKDGAHHGHLTAMAVTTVMTPSETGGLIVNRSKRSFKSA